MGTHNFQKSFPVLQRKIPIEIKYDLWLLLIIFIRCFTCLHNSSPNAIYMIHKYFSKQQLLNIITLNYYSILYCNAEICSLPTLIPQLIQKILSASLSPLKLTTNNYNHTMSCQNNAYYEPENNPKPKHNLQTCLTSSQTLQ